jgi:hypothetical protein
MYKMSLTSITPCTKRCVIFDSTAQRSKGVIKVIKNVFFPGFHHKFLRGARISNKGGLSFLQARRRGILIDSQLSKAIGNKIPPRSCDETKLIITFFRARGYYIEKAQESVGYSPWRLATAIDLILRPLDEFHDHRVIVEIKFGCLHRRLSVPNTVSQYIVPEVPTSPIFLHQLQTLIGKRLFELTDNTLPLEGAWLLYVDRVKGIECIEEKAFEVKWSKQVEETLESTANRLANGLSSKKKSKRIKK